MRIPWNKNLTKETNPSVLKISRTMKKRKVDNFSKWREKARKSGKIRSQYPELKKDGNLAELIGAILGDGYIGKFPRADVLRIVSNSNNPCFVKRYANLIKIVFDKQPSTLKRKTVNCIDITIYQKHIAKRIKIGYGSRGERKIIVPRWILTNREYIIRYLRGLYEAEGSFCVHKPTCTYKFLFSNKNTSMLNNVYVLLKKLGFSPHKSPKQIQISKKDEVFQIKDLLNFRKY